MAARCWFSFAMTRERDTRGLRIGTFSVLGLLAAARTLLSSIEFAADPSEAMFVFCIVFEERIGLLNAPVVSGLLKILDLDGGGETALLGLLVICLSVAGDTTREAA